MSAVDEALRFRFPGSGLPGPGRAAAAATFGGRPVPRHILRSRARRIGAVDSSDVATSTGFPFHLSELVCSFTLGYYSPPGPIRMSLENRPSLQGGLVLTHPRATASLRDCAPFFQCCLTQRIPDAPPGSGASASQPAPAPELAFMEPLPAPTALSPDWELVKRTRGCGSRSRTRQEYIFRGQMAATCIPGEKTPAAAAVASGPSSGAVPPAAARASQSSEAEGLGVDRGAAKARFPAADPPCRWVHSEPLWLRLAYWLPQSAAATPLPPQVRRALPVACPALCVVLLVAHAFLDPDYVDYPRFEWPPFIVALCLPTALVMVHLALCLLFVRPAYVAEFSLERGEVSFGLCQNRLATLGLAPRSLRKAVGTAPHALYFQTPNPLVARQASAAAATSRTSDGAAPGSISLDWVAVAHQRSDFSFITDWREFPTFWSLVFRFGVTSTRSPQIQSCLDRRSVEGLPVLRTLGDLAMRVPVVQQVLAIDAEAERVQSAPVKPLEHLRKRRDFLARRAADAAIGLEESREPAVESSSVEPRQQTPAAATPADRVMILSRATVEDSRRAVILVVLHGVLVALLCWNPATWPAWVALKMTTWVLGVPFCALSWLAALKEDSSIMDAEWVTHVHHTLALQEAAATADARGRGILGRSR